MEKLIEMGKKMGLDGEKLLEFCTEQQKIEREERAAEREEQRAKREAEAEAEEPES